MDLIAVQETDLAAHGAVVYWGLSGDVQIANLKHLCAQHGIAQVPKYLSATDFAHRAFDRTNVGKLLLRSVRNTTVESCVCAYVIVNEYYSEGRPHFVDAIDIWIAEGELGLELHTRVLVEGFEAVATNFSAEFERVQTVYSARDISTWLTSLVHASDCVRLRESGGVYFIPSAHREQWKNIALVVDAAGAGTVYTIPVMNSREAIQAVCAALREELSKTVNHALDVIIEPGATAAAKNKQLQLLQKEKQKLSMWESTLGVLLPELRSQLEQLETGVNMATIVGI